MAPRPSPARARYVVNNSYAELYVLGDNGSNPATLTVRAGYHYPWPIRIYRQLLRERCRHQPGHHRRRWSTGSFNVNLHGNWTNEGTIKAESSGSLTVSTSSFTNAGLIQAQNAGGLTVSSTNLTTGGDLDAKNGTISVSSTIWTNTGKHEAENGGVISASAEPDQQRDCKADSGSTLTVSSPNLTHARHLGGGPAALAGGLVAPTDADALEALNGGTLNVNGNLSNIGYIAEQLSSTVGVDG